MLDQPNLQQLRASTRQHHLFLRRFRLIRVAKPSVRGPLESYVVFTSWRRFGPQHIMPVMCGGQGPSGLASDCWLCSLGADLSTPESANHDDQSQRPRCRSPTNANDAATLPTVSMIVAADSLACSSFRSPQGGGAAGTHPMSETQSDVFPLVMRRRNPNTTLFTPSSTTEVSHQRLVQFSIAMIVSIRSLNADAARSKPT